MKRLVAMILVGVLMFSLVGCGGKAEPVKDTGEPVAVASNTPKPASTSKPESVATPKPVTTPEPVRTPEPVEEKVKVDFQEGSYTFKDEDGYEFEVTVKVSPWIPQSSTKLVDAAWGEVGKGKELPTVSSLNLEDMTGDSTRYYRETGKKSAFSCRKSNFDMYYAVGTISIKNITSGFKLSEENQRSIPLFFDSGSFENKEYLDLPVICRTYFSTPTDMAPDYTYRYIKLGTALMKSDSWGPVTFALVHGESYSPNNLDGIYRSDLDVPLRFSHWQLVYDLSRDKDVSNAPVEYILTLPMSVLE